jgi:hypothetical protein
LIKGLHSRSVGPDTLQHILPDSFTKGSLDSWTIVGLTATKFEPFLFHTLGFASLYILNIHIIMIFNDFCLFPAYFGYIIIKVRNLESQEYSAGRFIRSH